MVVLRSGPVLGARQGGATLLGGWLRLLRHVHGAVVITQTIPRYLHPDAFLHGNALLNPWLPAPWLSVAAGACSS
jgi:hypothetical protein